MHQYQEDSDGVLKELGLNSRRPDGRPHMRRQPVLALISCRPQVPENHQHLLLALRRNGWQVHEFPSQMEWDEILQEVVPDVLLLLGEVVDVQRLNEIIGLVKRRGEGVCVVAQVASAGPGMRMAILKAGADVCLNLAESSEAWVAAELIAVIEAVHQARTFGLARGWSLTASGRTLIGPHGVKLGLTPVEARFLECLFSSPGCCIRRSTSEQDGEKSRKLDVVVARLRNKARAFGIDLPLRAVRHWGYIFLADLTE